MTWQDNYICFRRDENFVCFSMFWFFLLEGKQDLSVGEFDIRQICIVFKDSLVLILFDFSILSMIIWLWSYYFTSFIFLVYDVGFIHVFRLNSCLEKTWNWLEQVWKLKKSRFDIWEEWRVVTMGTTRNRGLLWWVVTMSRVGTVQSSRIFWFEKSLYFGHNLF